MVKDVWSKMRHLVLEISRGYEEICLCGDCRNYSPGHSAQICVYTLMEHVTKVVVDLEVLVKRETGGNAAVMERKGLRRLLEGLMKDFPLNELCTDGSTKIIKLVRDIKGKLLFLLQLNVWNRFFLGDSSLVTFCGHGYGRITEEKTAGFLLRLRATNLWTVGYGEVAIALRYIFSDVLGEGALFLHCL